MESSTKTYGVPMLFSEAFYCLLSPTVKKFCRMVDRIRRKESEDPQTLYTYDADISVDFADPKVHSQYLDLKKADVFERIFSRRHDWGKSSDGYWQQQQQQDNSNNNAFSRSFHGFTSSSSPNTPRSTSGEKKRSTSPSKNTFFGEPVIQAKRITSSFSLLLKSRQDHTFPHSASLLHIADHQSIPVLPTTPQSMMNDSANLLPVKSLGEGGGSGNAAAAVVTASSRRSFFHVAALTAAAAPVKRFCAEKPPSSSSLRLSDDNVEVNVDDAHSSHPIPPSALFVGHGHLVSSSSSSSSTASTLSAAVPEPYAVSASSPLTMSSQIANSPGSDRSSKFARDQIVASFSGKPSSRDSGKRTGTGTGVVSSLLSPQSSQLSSSSPPFSSGRRSLLADYKDYKASEEEEGEEPSSSAAFFASAFAETDRGRGTGTDIVSRPPHNPTSDQDVLRSSKGLEWRGLPPNENLSQLSPRKNRSENVLLKNQLGAKSLSSSLSSARAHTTAVPAMFGKASRGQSENKIDTPVSRISDSGLVMSKARLTSFISAKRMITTHSLKSRRSINLEGKKKPRAPELILAPYDRRVWEVDKDLRVLRHRFENMGTVWEMSMGHYIRGEWTEALELFKCFDNDSVATFLLQFMEGCGGKPPRDWKGCREEWMVTDKS